MPSSKPTSESNLNVARRLEETLCRVKPWVMARLLWDRVLVDQEQRKLGRDMEKCYRALGTVGMWRQLHGGTQVRAIIEVGRKLDVLTETEYHWLLRETGEVVVAGAQPDTPSWDTVSGELRLNGKVIRRLRVLKEPSNIQLVAEAFQREGWQPRVRNPLTGGQEQLHQTVQSLNHGLKAIRFRVQEGGTAITWARI